ncbi:MAG TPA: CoA ester lyase [Woeseiaceae bacterium]|nr:CoA ester lyase [Woeseiaceae bacterium]
MNGCIRSFLFSPADSERKLQKALAAGADAVIFDLEDSVAAAKRPDARKIAAAHINGRDDVWVRINPLDSDDADLDLEAVLPAGPAGIVLPKPESAADAIDLAARLEELEAAAGHDPGQTQILCICTERPEALFSLGGYAGATPRLAGLSWGAEDLSAAVGASETRDKLGNWLAPYQLARSLCLFAAAAAEVAAVDTVFTNLDDETGLQRYASCARRDGFTGMLAIHPAQIETINDAFRPSKSEIQHAQRILRAFAENPDAGALAVDGAMVDRPHWVQAQRIVALAEAIENKR